MKRRKFLKIGGICVGVTAAVPVIGYSVTSFEGIATNLILNNCNSLKIERVEARKFVDDFYTELFKSWSDKEIIQYKLKLKTYYFGGIAAEQSEMVQALVRNFLLSSDFFINKMDSNEPLHYLALYNPYQRPCANPFSALYYPSKNILTSSL